MATIRKSSTNRWQAIIRRVGVPVQSKTFSSRADCQLWARTVESELDRGALPDRAATDRLSLGVLIDRYIREVTPRKKGATQDKRRMLFLKSRLGDLSVGRIRPSHIAGHRDARKAEGKSAATITLELAALSHLFSTAIKEWDLSIPQNPVQLVRKPTIRNARSRRLWVFRGNVTGDSGGT